MLKQTASARLSTKQLTKVGMLSAICIILGVTKLGFIPLPMVQATIMHVPVIIGAILEGPKVGMLIGFIFGAFSMLQAIIAPTSILSFTFVNPLVSILPRVLIGVTTYYCYKWLSKKLNQGTATTFAAAVGSFTNTIGVLGMIYIFYIEKYAEAANKSIDAAIAILYGVATTNGVAEAIVAAIITTGAVLAIRKIERR
jgi:uncharacterized membrane protein